MYLDNITNKKEYKIKNVNTDELVKRRLYDIGIIGDSKIKLIHISPSNMMKAYLVKNSLIAIRDKDASQIEVYDD